MHAKGSVTILLSSLLSFSALAGVGAKIKCDDDSFVGLSSKYNATSPESVCDNLKHDEPRPGHDIYHGKDFEFTATRVTTGVSYYRAYGLGHGVYLGTVSFQINNPEQSTTTVKIEDGSGQFWIANVGQKVRFDKITLPVKFSAYRRSTTAHKIQVTDVHYGITGTDLGKPIKHSAKFANNGLGSKLYANLATHLYRVRTRIKVKFSADFFKNFANESNCNSIQVVDKKNEQVLAKLTQNAPVEEIWMNTFDQVPKIDRVSDCASSRLASPESSSADFVLTYQLLDVGAPH